MQDLREMPLESKPVHPDPGPVNFYLPDPGLESLRHADPDRDWRLFTQGERVWVLQTYLRLRQAGYPVALTDEVPDRGVLVISAQRRHEFRLGREQRRRLLVVATVQDLASPAVADLHIVQDPRQSGPIHTLHVAHWPQPGLVPRDTSRGARIERIEFKGTTENLDPAFRRDRWIAQLAALGIEWREDALPSADAARDPSRVHWNDYREVDLVLAVRPGRVIERKAKPASKLIAAWLAGCPALLGPEPAFRQLRRSALDYIEVRTPADALREIAALKEQPARYRAMVDNGRARGAACSVEHVTQQWADALFHTLPERVRNPAFQRWRRRPLLVRRLQGLLQR